MFRIYAPRLPISSALLADSEDAGSMDTEGQLDIQMEGPWRYRSPESRKTGKCCGDIYAFAKMYGLEKKVNK